MGRDSSMPGPSRDDRAKRAKTTVNTTIPAILKSTPRARKGVESATLITDPPPVKPDEPTQLPTENGSHPNGPGPGPVVSIRVTDTLDAAHAFMSSAEGPLPRVAILNMASPLRPGGGVLSGATSQEEWLCARTTLYPSLREEFYRLPEVGGVYTPDVLVFRRWDEDASDLAKKDWFYVDVITSAMIRLPDVEGEGGEKRYAEEKDRELATRKMKAVLRMVRSRGVNKLVLGAWGCGAYGNPVGEIGRGWRKVLFGTPAKAGATVKGKESWEGLEVVFAIKDAQMAVSFANSFGGKYLTPV